MPIQGKRLVVVVLLYCVLYTNKLYTKLYMHILNYQIYKGIFIMRQRMAGHCIIGIMWW